MVVFLRSGLDDHLGTVVYLIGTGAVSIRIMGNDSGVAIMIRNLHSTPIYVIGFERQGERVNSKDAGDSHVRRHSDLLLKFIATDVAPAGKVIVLNRRGHHRHVGAIIHVIGT